MAQFYALAPGVEVNGAAVLSVVRGMVAFEDMALGILAAHGIVAPKEGEWYPQQAWLDAFREIAERIGGSTLKTIGRSIPNTALWPPDVDTIEKALASIDVAYHLNHRGGEIGHYVLVETAPRSAKMVCGNPYPCQFDLGIIEATAKKFAPRGVSPLVRHDDTQECRNTGGESCTYNISW